MNRGNCLKTTPIPEYEWCVIKSETSEILARYVTKSSAVKLAKDYNELEADVVRVEKIKNPDWENYQ